MNVRHILGISGGKDSTALAVYLKKYYFVNDNVDICTLLEILNKKDEKMNENIGNLQKTYRHEQIQYTYASATL